MHKRIWSNVFLKGSVKANALHVVPISSSLQPESVQFLSKKDSFTDFLNLAVELIGIARNSSPPKFRLAANTQRDFSLKVVTV